MSHFVPFLCLYCLTDWLTRSFIRSFFLPISWSISS
jgi:hypothetical protein